MCTTSVVLLVITVLFMQHFVCAKCEKPFLGHRHYEKKGLAYCETHYHQLFGNLCFVCNQVIAGDGTCSTWTLASIREYQSQGHSLNYKSNIFTQIRNVEFALTTSTTSSFSPLKKSCVYWSTFSRNVLHVHCSHCFEVLFCV